MATVTVWQDDIEYFEKLPGDGTAGDKVRRVLWEYMVAHPLPASNGSDVKLDVSVVEEPKVEEPQSRLTVQQVAESLNEAWQTTWFTLASKGFESYMEGLLRHYPDARLDEVVDPYLPYGPESIKIMRNPVGNVVKGLRKDFPYRESSSVIA